MTIRPHYRRHSQAFKLQLCADIRSGVIGRRDAQKKYELSDNLIHLWLARYDGKLLADPPQHGPDIHSSCEAKISALERKVGQLTMLLDECEQRVVPVSAKVNPSE